MNCEELETRGVTLLPAMVNSDWLIQLTDAVDGAFEAHRLIQTKNNVEITTGGVALHVILNSDIFIDFLLYLSNKGLFNEIRDGYFESNFILNSFGSLNSLPGKPNFSSIVHRDIRFFSGDLNMMLNMLVMLDDFTAENGATLLLPGSHKIADKPEDEDFHKNAEKVLGKKGDILIFNSNVWHAAGHNSSEGSRRALTLTFSRSFVKQQMDYPRAIGFEKIETYPEEIQQLVGYYSRVPVNLDEWYQPMEKRFYRKDQD